MAGALSLAVLVGLGFGLAMTLILRGLFAPKPRLSEMADGTYRSKMQASSSDGLAGSMKARLLLWFPPDKFMTGDLESSLRITGSTPEGFIISKFMTATAGFFLPIVGWVAMSIAGFNIPIVAVVFGCLFFAVIGFIVPSLTIRDQAKERREEFQSAFASYLDLARILVSASDGPESALEKAAEYGSGWAFAEIRGALQRARSDASVRHWDALGQVGAELDIRDLREFANALSANATSSSIGDTLRSRAENLRNKVMSAIEEEAEGNTTKMLFPTTMMLLGLMIYVFYGVLMSTFSGGASFVG